MRQRKPRDPRCCYVVVIDQDETSDNTIRDLANYLSTLGLAACDVVVIDRSRDEKFDEHARVLRWVARHVSVRNEHCAPSGPIDIIRAAALVSTCEKVIVAEQDVRYTDEAIGSMCQLLDRHEVVEPQDYLAPLSWWSGIEAGRILVHRAVDSQPDHGATFGFRRSAIPSLTSLGAGEVLDDQVRRLAAAGAEVYPAGDIFVRREPTVFSRWFAERPRAASEDFSQPMKNVFFFSLLPLLSLLALFGGLRLAGSYASAIALGSVVLAVRGRLGARDYFPLHACLLAPVWVFERSVSVYWALMRRLRGLDVANSGGALPERGRGEKVASGE